MNEFEEGNGQSSKSATFTMICQVFKHRNIKKITSSGKISNDVDIVIRMKNCCPALKPNLYNFPINSNKF